MMNERARRDRGTGERTKSERALRNELMKARALLAAKLRGCFDRGSPGGSAINVGRQKRWLLSGSESDGGGAPRP